MSIKAAISAATNEDAVKHSHGNGNYYSAGELVQHHQADASAKIADMINEMNQELFEIFLLSPADFSGF